MESKNIIGNIDQEQAPFNGSNPKTVSQPLILQLKQDQIFWLEAVSMFVFIFGSTCFKQNTGLDLQFFLSMLMAIPICAQQSGAHLNPGVSLGSYLNYGSSMKFRIFWVYAKAQFWGALISVFIALILNNVYRSPIYPIEFTNVQYFQFMASQALGTFILLFFVLSICSKQNYIDNKAAKFVYVAIFVYIGRKFATISTSQINVALTLSRALVGIPYCDFEGLKFVYIWIIGGFIGVILAIIIYSGLAQPTIQYIKQKNLHQKQKNLHQHYNIQSYTSVNERDESYAPDVEMSDMKGP